MKKTQIIKMSVNTVMTMLYISLLFVSFTGIVFHEIAGVVLLGLVIAHLILNRRWIKGITKQLLNGDPSNKTQFMYVLNGFLLLSMLIVTITGLCISQVIIPLGIRSAVISALHKWSAYVCLCLCVVHVSLHWRYIGGFFKKLRTTGFRRAWQSVSAIASLIIILGILFSRIGFRETEPSINSTANDADVPANTEIIEGKPEDDEEKTAIQNTPDAADAISLSDYLGKLVCTACPRHCSLLHPQCGKGQRQVQQATVQYEEIYGDS